MNITSEFSFVNNIDKKSYKLVANDEPFKKCEAIIFYLDTEDYHNYRRFDIPIDVQVEMINIINQKNNNKFLPSIVVKDDRKYRVKIMPKLDQKIVKYVENSIESKISKEVVTITNSNLKDTLMEVKRLSLNFEFCLKLDLKAAFYKVDIKKVLDELEFDPIVKKYLYKVYLENKYYLKNDLDEIVPINYKELYINDFWSANIFGYILTKINNKIELKNYLVCADDYILFSNSKEELFETKKKLSDCLKEYNLEFNNNKEEFITQNESIIFLKRFIRFNNNPKDIKKLEENIEKEQMYSTLCLDYANFYEVIDPKIRKLIK